MRAAESAFPLSPPACCLFAAEGDVMAHLSVKLAARLADFEADHALHIMSTMHDLSPLNVAATALVVLVRLAR